MAKIVPILVVICLAITCPAPAEDMEGQPAIIRLKNKGRLEGVIKGRTEGGVVIDLGYGTVAVPARDIDSIETPAGDEKGRVLDSWQRHIRATQKSEKERKKEAEAVRGRIEESLRVKQEMEARARKEGEHRISFADSSKIKVDAILNGAVKVEFIVDTGASTVLIPIETARGLPDIGPLPDKKVETKLADGTVREGTPIVLRSIEVAGLKAEDVEAVAMDLKGHDGLLGMSFLNRFHVWIDAEKNELVLKKK
jgi:clan AA aspartic protease (TIGR02281 family)